MRPVLAALGASFLVTLVVLVVARGDDGAARVAPQGQEIALGVAAPDRRGPTAARIDELAREARGGDAGRLVALAEAQLQQARESVDPDPWYERADRTLERALARRPEDPAALTARGTLRAARHDFAAALEDGLRARDAAPDSNAPLAVVVDGLVELGRVEEAEEVLQEMVDRRPGPASYARIAYVRELRGDLDGADEALDLAISASPGRDENAAYLLTLRGDLALSRGRPSRARTAYRAALRRFPGLAAAELGLARTAAAQGDLRLARGRLERLVGRDDRPAHLIALAEVLRAGGRTRAAARLIAPVLALHRGELDAGRPLEPSDAIVEANFGEPQRAVPMARAIWARTPSVGAADAMGWALTRTGRHREALTWARRSLALGSRAPATLFRAGTAAARAGRADLARRWLRRSLRQAPRFSPVDAELARRELDALR